MGRKLALDVAQRYEAVMASLRGEEPAAAIACRHGISEATLYRLRDEFLAAGKEALSDGRSQGRKREDRIATLERALAEQDGVMGELMIANRPDGAASGMTRRLMASQLRCLLRAIRQWGRV